MFEDKVKKTMIAHYERQLKEIENDIKFTQSWLAHYGHHLYEDLNKKREIESVLNALQEDEEDAA